MAGQKGPKITEGGAFTPRLIISSVSAKNGPEPVEKEGFLGMIGEAIMQPKELLTMPEIPWLKRFEEEPKEEEPDVDYEVVLMELEYR